LLNRIRQFYIPILAQITVPYILLAAALAAGGTYLVTQVVVDSVQERFQNQLIETGFLADENIVREEKDLLEALRLISNIQGVDAGVLQSQPQTLRDLILPIAYNSNIEALAILGVGGRAIISLELDPTSQVYETLQATIPFSRLSFVQPVLRGSVDEKGDKYGGFAATSAGSIFFVVGPIKDASGQLVGAALVGRSVQSLSQLIREQTLSQVSFYTLEGVSLSTTLLGGQPIDLTAVQNILENQAQGSYAREFRESNIDYHELLTPLEVRVGEDIGIMGVALPAGFLSQTTQITRGNTLVLLASALLLVVVVGAVIAGRITKPIRDLRDAAQKVAGGNLQVNVRSGRSDEIGTLTQSFNTMVDSLNQSKRDLVEAYDKTIEGWARAMDLRDHETEGHSRRVADLSTALAASMGIRGDEMEHLRRGALLHDVGKIAIPDSILLKKGKLTEDEIKQMQQHPIYAKQFMEQIEYLKPALPIPYSHHEKWDGSGYPQGLKGEAIPYEARIFAIVDVWDAITSDRPYRKAMSFQEALEYIESESDHHFEPKVVQAFKRLLGR
jgi:HD-GYP domain-containing protein (c-di-GMP phosphodiesterase class II)